MPKNSGKMKRQVIFGDFIYVVKIEAEDDDDGYVGSVVGLPGCLSDGETVEELLENIKDAIECYLEALEDMRKEGMLVKVDLSKRKLRKASA